MEETEELDTSWTDNYDENEKQLITNADILKEPVDKIHVYNLYINKYNSLEKITISDLEVDRYFHRKDLVNYIKEKSVHENIHYKVLSLLKYNIDLEKEQLYDYITNTSQFKYLESLKSLDDIEYNDSLSIFEGIHSLFILFYEKKKHGHTKKVLLNKQRKTRRANK